MVSSPVSTPSKVGLAPLLALGIREARRMLLSPVYLVTFGFIAATTGLETATGGPAVRFPSVTDIYDLGIFLLTLYSGLLTYAVAHLVTSSSRRSGADSQLGALPTTERSRTIALCIGVLLGPGLVVSGFLIGLALLGNGIDSYAPGEPPIGAVGLAQIGLCVVGGGVFGVLMATWLRFPGSLPLGLVCLVMTVVWLAAAGDSIPILRWLAPWVTFAQWVDESWTTMGSQSWHLLYLAGLCSLAICGALLHQRAGRGGWLGVTAVVLLGTAVAGATSCESGPTHSWYGVCDETRCFARVGYPGSPTSQLATELRRGARDDVGCLVAVGPARRVSGSTHGLARVGSVDRCRCGVCVGRRVALVDRPFAVHGSLADRTASVDDVCCGGHRYRRGCVSDCHSWIASHRLGRLGS